MGRNLEEDYSYMFGIVNQLKSGQNPLTPLPKEKLEKLLKDGEEIAKYYGHWKTAKFFLGGKNKEDLKQGYLGAAEEFFKLTKKEAQISTGMAPIEQSTNTQAENPLGLENKLKSGQTLAIKDHWVLAAVYEGQKEESRTPVRDRETLIKLFQGGVNSPLITDISMLYLGPDGQYHKVKDPDQLPKKAG